MPAFIFEDFGRDAEQCIATETLVTAPSDAAALSRAGTLAKRVGGPVDIYRAGRADKPSRYITTAAPSEYHAKGYRFERLDS